ncbi:MAG: EAL domain-containing protein [Sneathiella sp.]|nr:EAL domain-containing protein [Sneathiella sp.]
MNVLIVDDDLIDREHIKRVLLKGDSSCNIVNAETVDDGLNKLKAQNFDVILLDYNLPQRLGIEFLEEFSSDNALSSTAVIMISTSEEENLALQCIQSGAQDFLTKAEISTFRLRRAILNVTARHELEQKLYKSYQRAKELAEIDSLTGLANRYVFDLSLKQGILNHRRGINSLALMLIDLDHFKYVNDTYGHDVGDQLLKDVVERVKTSVRDNELFARLGGDEFAVTLTNLTKPEDAAFLANRIINLLEEPFVINDVTIKTGASIGIAIHPDDGADSKELFRNADIALYRSKDLGRNQFTFFEQEMQNQFLSDYNLEIDLASALDKNELTLVYQPVFDIITSEITGVEALLRWKVKDTFIPPDTFIPIAEKSGSIVSIGRWVILEAIKQLYDFNKHRTCHISMAINLSPVQLADIYLIKDIEDCLQQHDIAPELIEFELTETTLLIDNSQSIHTIQAISDLGCKIALDDFGTGFSSLSHLQDYPINTVKIDKSLIASISEKERSKKLVQGMVELIKSLDLEAVAEGVEYQEQLALCKKMNINKVQGYYFEKPIPADMLKSKYLQ